MINQLLLLSKDYEYVRKTDKYKLQLHLKRDILRVNRAFHKDL